MKIFRFVLGLCLLIAVVAAAKFSGVTWAGIERVAALLEKVPLRVYVGITFIPIPAYIVWAMWNADRENRSTFKFVHLITNDKGRGSNKELAYTAAAVTSIWGIWALIVLDRITEWYMTGVLVTFAGSALIARYTAVKARQAGISEPPPDAGDDPETPPPTVERKTTVHEEVTERRPQVTNPLKRKGGGEMG